MKDKRGITLVALIITIIVMVILAGIIITAAVADGGIIDRAQMAGSNQDYAIAEELIKSKCEYITKGKNAGKVDLSKTARNIRSASIKEVKGMTSTENLLTVELNNGNLVEIEGVNGSNGTIGNIYGKDGQYIIFGENKLTIVGSQDITGIVIFADYKIISVQEALNMVSEDERPRYEQMAEELEAVYGKIENVLIMKNLDTLVEAPMAAFINGGNDLLIIDGGEIIPAQEDIEPELKKIIFKTAGQYKCYTNFSSTENNGNQNSATVIIDEKNGMINMFLHNKGVGLGSCATYNKEENDTKFIVKLNGADYTINTMEEIGEGNEIYKITDVDGDIVLIQEIINGEEKLYGTSTLGRITANSSVNILTFNPSYDIAEMGLFIE